MTGSTSNQLEADRIAFRRTQHVLFEVSEERKRQDDKHGHDRDHGLEVWLAILTEEVGEVAKALLELRTARRTQPLSVRLDRLVELDKELVQVAAVAVAMSEVVKVEKAWNEL